MADKIDPQEWVNKVTDAIQLFDAKISDIKRRLDRIELILMKR